MATVTVEGLSYVYEPLISKVLAEYTERWNSHEIRPTRLAGCPSGVPDDLYNLPQLTGILLLIIIRVVMLAIISRNKRLQEGLEL